VLVPTDKRKQLAGGAIRDQRQEKSSAMVYLASGKLLIALPSSVQQKGRTKNTGLHIGVSAKLELAWSHLAMLMEESFCKRPLSVQQQDAPPGRYYPGNQPRTAH